MKALKAAFADGLRVRIANKDIGAFRTPGQSDDAKKQALKENPNNPRAVASGWNSVHNYGLGIDLVVIDEKGNLIEPGWIDPTGQGRNWYSFYVKLKDYMRAQVFEWADRSSTGSSLGGDSGHFEYHPAWKGLFGKDIRPNDIPNKAIRDAIKAGKSGALDDWLPYLWNSAGACH